MHADNEMKWNGELKKQTSDSVNVKFNHEQERERDKYSLADCEWAPNK